MRIIIEDEVTTSKKDFFAFPCKTFKFQALPTNKFIIPLQQRDYDWSRGTSINELLADLDQHLINLPPSSAIPQDPATISNYYYSGTILCENQSNNNLKLIDGQQRITTISLLYLSLYLYYKSIDNSNEGEDIFRLLKKGGFGQILARLPGSFRQ